MINRKEYKIIKKFDRNQMEEYLENIYKKGFRDGAEAGDNADFRIKLSEVLGETKGVGPTLYDRIMDMAKIKCS